MAKKPKAPVKPKPVRDKRTIKPPKHRVIYDVGGRPPKYSTALDLAMAINAYLNDHKEEEWTLTGLALAVGVSVNTITSYMNSEDADIKEVMARGRLHIEHAYEIRGINGVGNGTMLWNMLKNMGFKDRTESHVEHTYTQMPTITATTKDGQVKAIHFDVGKKKKK